MGKIVSISNQKGGVGKTTTSINLSASVGILNKKVLVIDLDPQGNTTSWMGIDKRGIKLSAYDVLEKEISAEEAIINTGFKNLDLIPSHINLASADAGISLFSGKESKLKKIFLFLYSFPKKIPVPIPLLHRRQIQIFHPTRNIAQPVRVMLPLRYMLPTESPTEVRGQ